MKLTLLIIQRQYHAEVDFFSMEDYVDYKREEKIDNNQPKIDPTKTCYIKLPQVAQNQLLDEEHSSIRVKLYIQDILIGFINLSPDTENDINEYGCIEFSQRPLPDTDCESAKGIQSPKDALHECYGSVCFELSIQKGNQEYKRFFSEQVKIEWSDRTEANFKKMIDYINDHEKNLLQIDKDSNDKKALGIYSAVYRESGIDLWSSNSHSEDRKRWCEWATYIQLAQEIADIYEAEYGYFRTHPLTCIKKEINVGHVEQLSSISPATLQYISLHPESLQPVKSTEGIHIKGRTYQPQKTMFIKNTRSLDTYENGVILGFLQEVIRKLMSFQDEMEQLDNSAGNSDYHAGFTLIESILNQILNKVMQLSQMYKDALPIHAMDVHVKPHSSDIFLSVRQYKEIYKYIQKWFNDNMYDINDKELFMPLTRTSTLYERYFLTLLIQYFAKHENSDVSDSTIESDEQQNYSKWEYNPPVLKHVDNMDNLEGPVILNNWRYKNTEFNNTFKFRLSDTEEVTLYYQPVIYGYYNHPGRNGDNGIGLYRNNFIPYKDHVRIYEKEYNYRDFYAYRTLPEVSINVRNYNNSIHPENITEVPNYTSDFLVGYIQNVINASVYPDNQYYVPDFLIKYKNIEDENTKYMIFDTKFSSLNTVQNFELENLVYKYIISLSSFDEYQYDKYNSGNNPITITEHSPIRLCFAYGGQDESETPNSENNQEITNHEHISDSDSSADNGIENYAYVNLLHVYATKGEEDVFKQFDYIMSDFLKKGDR